MIPARDVLAPLLERPTSSANTVVAVGHAHIDCAWLWPLRETRRKCARTFSNQLRLLEHYPEHHFVCSQAVQYQWMKDGYPELFEQIAEQVRSGRWEPVGGMWVEPDTNVPSGESLVRQLVYGKRFFAEEFGVETHELWIPDVFGYSAALPQIAREAGVTSLITQKMSWNDTNRFPHTTFWWEGHDGSRLLAHFPPANTYNGDFSVGEVAAGQDRGLGPDGTALNLYPFGYGDGGGGPNHTMVERFRRMADLDGLPRTEIGTVAGFLHRLGQEADDLPVWVGELYLEAHRATLTTHAEVKLANRRAEEALRAAELWSVAATLDRRPDLDRAWKLLLLHQFHDILPGSSIHWVYEDTAREQAEVLAIAGSVITEAQTVVAGGEGAGSLVAFNPSSTDRTEVLELPDGSLALVSAPACGWSTVSPDRSLGGREQVAVGEGWLDNGLLRVEWDGDGLLTSVRDLVAGREVLADDERGNVFQLHDDHPRAFDAWDVDRTYLDQVTDLVAVDSIEVVERHPLRGAVRFIRSFGASTITQTMRLTAGTRRLEFHTDVKWHERHRFLKVAFPVSVRSTRATFEIQHGHLERPTVANTSWDEARFEVCGHRWADLSEPGYGVALLNESKYGYDILGHTIRLSLLRAPGFPDPDADQGSHHFAYALVPHEGDLRDAGVIAEAEHFNLPLSLLAGHGDGRVVSVDRPGVSVEAVKWADRSDALVVRLCEVWGSRVPCASRCTAPSYRWPAPISSSAASPLVARDGTVELELRPFELVTLAFDLGSAGLPRQHSTERDETRRRRVELPTTMTRSDGLFSVDPKRVCDGRRFALLGLGIFDLSYPCTDHAGMVVRKRDRSRCLRISMRASNRRPRLKARLTADGWRLWPARSSPSVPDSMPSLDSSDRTDASHPRRLPKLRPGPMKPSLWKRTGNAPAAVCLMGVSTYDAGALVAADRGERRLWARHRALLSLREVPTTPAPVVAQAWRRGSRQALLARLLVGSEIEPMNDDHARAVGMLAGQAGVSDVVDATSWRARSGAMTSYQF